MRLSTHVLRSKIEQLAELESLRSELREAWFPSAPEPNLWSMEERVSVRISLDSDGFVRRECPTCDREFKWLYTADELAATEPQEGGFYCPYCAVQASPDSWFTAAQVEYLGQAATGWASDQLDQMFNRPGSALNYTPGDRPPTPEPPPEPDDMRRVESQCHPEDPVKVAEDWVKPVHCLICGAEVEQPSVS